MAEEINKFIEERGKAWHVMQELIDAAHTEKREFTADEDTKYSKAEADYDKFEKMQERFEKTEERKKQLEGVQTRAVAKPDPTDQRGAGSGKETATKEAKDELQRSAFSKALLGDFHKMSGEERAAIQMDVDTKGGIFVAPLKVQEQLLIEVDSLTFFKKLANVETLTDAVSLGVLRLVDDLTDCEWTSELATGSLDESISFGGREVKPHPFAKLLKISNKLLRASSKPVEQILLGRAAAVSARTEEKAYLTGDGVGKPLGLFTISAQGNDTDRDSTEDNTTTDVPWDGMISAKSKLNSVYHPGASWIMHPDLFKKLRKKKDGNGQYQWAPSLVAGIPNQILDLPYYLSDFAPNTFTTGKRVAAVGNFKLNYTIAQALAFSVQRLNELYALTNQTGFVLRQEIDGAPVFPSAVAFVKLA